MRTQPISPRTTLETRGAFRPELQALRAVAVTIVVVYHLWPDYLPGGYVGVDVFFAISGYLMTAHIVRGVTGPGTFRLRTFYARRARRLLPASLLVLLVVGVATLLGSSPITWTDTGKNIVASAFYVENWSLLLNSVDYLGAGTGSIPTQHFWSLSVEEQFYLFWPILLVAVWFLTNQRRSAAPSRTPFVVAIAVVGLGSFVYSIVATEFDQPSAYFNTLTRVWEFALGGALALTLPALRIRRAIAIALTWVGLLVILFTSLAYTDLSPFPGWIALVPVLSTLAVISGGDQGGRFSLAPVVASRPVQFLGDISYSVYLWHWPLIVLLPDLLDRPLSGPMKVGILAVSLLLGWLSKRFVEDPFRLDGGLRRSSADGPHSKTSTRVVFLSALVGMVVVSLIGGSAWAVTQSRADAAQARLDSLGPPASIHCFGAAELGDPSCNAAPFGDAVYPDPLIARQNTGSTGCQQNTTVVDVLTCKFGSETGSLRVALAGDSHAGQWLSAMRVAAGQKDWSLDTFLRSGCGLSEGGAGGSGAAGRCSAWNDAVLQRLLEGNYDLVVVSVRSSKVGGGSFTAEELKTSASRMGEAWDALRDVGTDVVAIRDTPQPVSAGIFDLPTCAVSAADLTRDCTVSEDRALVRDPQIEAAAVRPSVGLVDMTEYFCSAGSCPPVIGNVLVYSDGHHMSAVYSSTLGPYLADEIIEAIP